MGKDMHHEHEHDEKCEHHHHEHCSCGHNHDHNEDNHSSYEHHEDDCTCSSCSCKDEYINVYTHDMSVVGSIKFRIEKPYDESAQILDDCMKEIANEVTKNGGIIGHIKAFMVSEGDSLMISITDEESTKRHIKGQYVNFEGVAIVFGVEPNKLRKILEAALDSLKAK